MTDLPTQRDFDDFAAWAGRDVLGPDGARLGAGVLEDVRLLVTELITNALRHGKLTPGDHVTVRASVADDVVRIEVRDPGNDGNVTPREPGPRGGGYGLYLVDRLARRWGVDQRDGTVVWCELAPATGR